MSCWLGTLSQLISLADPATLPSRRLLCGEQYEHESAPLPLRQPRPAAKFPATTEGSWLRHKAPLLGEHTTELLLEAGMTDEEIASLLEAGVVLQGEARKLDPSKSRDASKRDVNSG